MNQANQGSLLIAVSDQDRRVALTSALAAGGCEARVASDGLELIWLYAAEQPRVVFLDLPGPVFDGAHMTTVLRALPDRDPCPIILAAATADDGLQERLLASGVDRIVPFPADIAGLQKTVDELAQQPARSTARREDAAARSAGAVDLKTSLARLGGEESLLADVIQFFFEDCYGLLNATHQAISQENWDEARRAAHSLKGLISNFSAAAAVAALQAIETAGQGTASVPTG
ncbi:MAG: Hpt domain-containing protein, partial [Singulisphaera sp.]